MIAQGVTGSFATAHECATIIRKLKSQGYQHLDAFAPFPDRSIEEALGEKRSPLPWIVVTIAFSGAGLAYLILWYTMVIDYPLNIGGRPLHPVPAFIPITFEIGILSSAFASLLGMLALGKMPRLHHPIDEVPGFDSATRTEFWVAIDARDKCFDGAETTALLRDWGASNVALFGGIT